MGQMMSIDVAGSDMLAAGDGYGRFYLMKHQNLHTVNFDVTRLDLRVVRFALFH
jgi:hypothetical protein